MKFRMQSGVKTLTEGLCVSEALKKKRVILVIAELLTGGIR